MATDAAIAHSCGRKGLERASLIMLSREVEQFAQAIQIQAHQTRGARLWAIKQVRRVRFDFLRS